VETPRVEEKESPKRSESTQERQTFKYPSPDHKAANNMGLLAAL